MSSTKPGPSTESASRQSATPASASRDGVLSAEQVQTEPGKPSRRVPRLAAPHTTRSRASESSPSGIGYTIEIRGAPKTPLRDFYHLVMLLSWPSTIGLVALGYLLFTALFALGYLASGGIHNAQPGSFEDALYFSVQTVGTIGYGAMYPESRLANVLVLTESTLGLVLTALAAGLVFAKFSRPTARVVFSQSVTISMIDGVPTLAFRVGNARKNRILEATVRLVLTRTETTAEGRVFYRMLDLKPVRERMPSLSRAWMVLHRIDEESPLYGETPESLARKEAELAVTVLGMDDTWMQTVVASHVYSDGDIAWGYHPVDILCDLGAHMIVDLTKFHAIEPVSPARSEESEG